MERARGVDDERRPGAVAEGRWQGHRSDRYDAQLAFKFRMMRRLIEELLTDKRLNI